MPALTGRFMRRYSSDKLDERDFWALKEVSFTVSKGEALGIIGDNGAGKSTMLKLLTGIMKPTVGAIHVQGRLSALIEVGAGFHPDLTGRENVFLNGVILGMTRQEINSKFDEIVAFSGLEEFIDTPVKRYSSGMHARLGFSVAAHVEPDILLVDEVLSVGDYLFQKKCVEKMNQVIKRGATVVFVSHNLRAVADLCDRSLLLDHGQIVEDGNTNDVIQSYMTRNSVVGRKNSEKPVYISNVRVLDEDRECVHFSSGQTVSINVEVSARGQKDRLAVAIYVQDGNYYEIFNTSTERLGHGNFEINAGQSIQRTFELSLHLAEGTYYVGVVIYRYDVEKEYDKLFPAATIFVRGRKDVGGVVDLNPTVVDNSAIEATSSKEESA